MANKNLKCMGCKYNTPMTKGGEGRICNGYTQHDFGRCPEWAITLLQKGEVFKI